MKHKCTPKCYDEGYEAGELEERKRVLEIITNFPEQTCGWVEDSCPMIDRDELKQKIQETK